MFTIKQNKICFKLYIRKAVTKVFSFYDLIRPVLPQALFKKVKQICLRDKIDLQIDIFFKPINKCLFLRIGVYDFTIICTDKILPKAQ